MAQQDGQAPSPRDWVRSTLVLCALGTGVIACVSGPVIVNRTPSTVPRNDANEYTIEADIERGPNRLIAVTARIDGLDWTTTSIGSRHSVTYFPSPCTQSVAYEFLVDYNVPLRTGGFSPRTTTLRSPVVGRHAMGIDGEAPSACPTTEFAHVFRVNTMADAVDMDTQNAICDTSAGACSLRAAVMQANASPGQDLISLPPGDYRIDRFGSESAAVAAVQDLDITDGVAIVGEGPGVVIGTRGLEHRVFEVHPLSVGAFVVLKDLELTRGATEAGGALRTRAPTRLENVRISNNDGWVQGAAIFNESTLQLERCSVVNNIGTAAARGIVFNTGGLLIRQSYIGENRRGFGAIVNDGGRMSIVNSTFSGNQSGSVAFGSAITTNVPVSLKNVTVLANTGVAPVFRTLASDAWVILQNSIVAVEAEAHTLCSGQILSSGANYLPVRERFGRCSVRGEEDDIHAAFFHDGIGLDGGETLSVVPRSDSLAVDGATVSCPLVDQRGSTRPLDGNADGAAVCDLGARERDPS